MRALADTLCSVYSALRKVRAPRYISAKFTRVKVRVHTFFSEAPTREREFEEKIKQQLHRPQRNRVRKLSLIT